jgi:hypothetical protein
MHSRTTYKLNHERNQIEVTTSEKRANLTSSEQGQQPICKCKTTRQNYERVRLFPLARVNVATVDVVKKQA